MAKSFTVKARLEAEDRASATVEKVEGRFARFGNFLSSRFVVTLGDVTRIFRTVTGAIGDVIAASAVQERAVKSLDAALSGLGSSAGGVSKALQEQAAALEKSTRFGDEAIITGQALLATYTQNEEQLKRATQSAVDFAAATGRDLNTAFLLLSKAAAGNTAELSKYGIVLNENIPAAEKFSAVLDKMGSQFAGRAAADAKTFSGLLAQLGNAWSTLQEQAGDAITQNQEIQESLHKIKEVLTSEGTISAVVSLTEALAGLTADTAAVIERLNGISEASAKAKASLVWDTATFFPRQFKASMADMFNSLLGIEGAAIRAGAATEAMAGSTAGSTEVVGLAASKQNEYAAAIERTNRIQREVTSAAAGFDEAVHALGVTLEDDVNQALENNNRLMDQAEDLYRRGVITRRDFEAVQRAVARANEETTMSLRTQIDAFGDLSSATEDSAHSFESFVRSVQNSTDGLGAFTRSSTQATAAMSSTDRKYAAKTLSPSSFNRVGGGTFSVPVGATFYYDENYTLRYLK